MDRSGFAPHAALAVAALAGCHWLIEHDPSRPGAPADFARARREQRVAPDVTLLDSARPSDLPPPPSDALPTLLFSDDFTAPGGLVDDGVGSWSVANGVYRQTTCDAIPESAVPGKAWTNVTASVKVRADAICWDLPLIFPKMNEAGLLVRVASYQPAGCTNNRYYYCVLDFFSHELYVGERKGDPLCNAAESNPVQLPPLKLGAFYPLEVSAKGKLITCRAQVDGAWHSSSWTDSSANAIPSGTVGLVADELKASFDELRVTALP